MASVNGVSKNNYTSSLYNSANIVSGLASGMDTEGMIESLVQSYNTKITQLNQKATKVQWKQEAYQSIIAKMYGFSNKYASYTSSTNLSSPSFFSSARLVEPQGGNAGKVAASGRTDSDVVLNSVSQLAAAARYTTGSKLVGAGDGTAITSSGGVDFNRDITLGTLQGSLSLNYGNKSITINFDENTDKYMGAEQLAQAIREKLSQETIGGSNGTSLKASDRISVQVREDNSIVFSDKSGAGNNVYISGASGTVGAELGLGDLSTASKDKPNVISSTRYADYTKRVNTGEYLSGKTMNIDLDGTTKTINTPQIVHNEDGTYTFTMPTTIKDSSGASKVTYEGGKQYTVSTKEAANKYAELLDESVRKAFGNKVKVSNQSANGSLYLKFETREGSNLLIDSDIGDVLKIGKNATNYLDPNKTLGDLMGSSFDELLDRYEEIDKDGWGTGKVAFTINGEKIGSYGKDTKLITIMEDINANKEANVKVNYSKTTRSFVFESRETGSQSKVELGEGLAQSMFGSTVNTDTLAQRHIRDFLGADKDVKVQGQKFSLDIDGREVSFSFVGDNPTMQNVLDKINQNLTDGQTAAFSAQDGSLVVTDREGNRLDVAYGDGIAADLFQKVASENGYTMGRDAKFKVTVNGIEKEMSRGSNTVDIDGLSITMKEKFEDDGEGVSFKVTTDSDKIVETVRSMINDYNEMMEEIKSAYATLPYKNSSGNFQNYEPLTDEDRATMSESAIQAYEAKAKQGILFGDSNLKSLYERMYNVFNPSSSDSAMLRKIGITLSYSVDGTSSVTLDENKLRDALDSDPDAVASLFTRTSDSGGTSGIMEGLKTQLDRYGSTTGATKGILVQQSGTPLSALSLLDNAWQKEIDNLGTQIEKWQDKLSDRVDYYTKMFSRLEVLVNQMNSQSSTLAGLMGG